MESRSWIHLTQVPEMCGARNLEFDHVGIALSAAESGQGVAIVSSILCAREVAEGRLCVPFDLRVPSPSTYHLVCKEGRLADLRVVAFRHWLVQNLA
ncbi:MAG: LysR family glycine cleavage system transcriptional activator [Myxococcota bacterium]|jgi:LysR family glycine cleavage system transcriptional activator